MSISGSWNVLLVEDEEIVRRQVKEYLGSEVYDGRRLSIVEISSLEDALGLITDRKTDLVILDIYRGRAERGADRTGIAVLESIQLSGFVPVVIYTALAEGLESYQSCFVRLVAKDVGGLTRLKHEVDDLFRLHIPQVYRAIVTHLDQSLCSYMWQFVQPHWAEFEAIVDKPEFLRLVVQRLARSFAHEGIDEVAARVFGDAAVTGVDPEKVHPAECYIKPPLGSDPFLGDIRVREGADSTLEYVVVLWPSCDMVSTGGRTPKTDRVLCARASPMLDIPEVLEWISAPSNRKKDIVIRTMKNERAAPGTGGIGSSDRYHYLPGAWDIPHLVVDFQILEHVELARVQAMRCLGTLASPFAEALGNRFGRYLGRIGTPDVDFDTAISDLERKARDV